MICSTGCGSKSPDTTRRTTLFFSPNESKAIYFDEVYKTSFGSDNCKIHVASYVTKSEKGKLVFNYIIESDSLSEKGCLVQWDLVDLVISDGHPNVFELRPGDRYRLKYETFDSPAWLKGNLHVFEKTGEFDWKNKDVTVDRLSQNHGWIDVSSWSASQSKAFGPVPNSKVKKAR